MNYHRGFAALTILLIILGIIVIGGAGYVALNPQVLKAPSPAPEESTNVEASLTDADTSAVANVSTETTISWKFEDAGEWNYAPHTKVTVIVNGVPHVIGTYQGACWVISGASGGIDGTGLVAGEVTGAQCWFAGGGNEIGVFNENGKPVVKVGELGEPTAETPGFRGDFKTKLEL